MRHRNISVAHAHLYAPQNPFPPIASFLVVPSASPSDSRSPPAISLLRRAPRGGRGGRGGQAQLPRVRRSSLEVAMAPFFFAALASSSRWLRQTGAATARAEVEFLEVDMASRGTCRCRRFFLDEVGRRRVDAWNRDLFAGNCLRLCSLQLANC